MSQEKCRACGCWMDQEHRDNPEECPRQLRNPVGLMLKDVDAESVQEALRAGLPVLVRRPRLRGVMLSTRVPPAQRPAPHCMEGHTWVDSTEAFSEHVSRICSVCGLEEP